ncbi:MAG: hypothetical protein L0332_19470 [Chloroflexi bacterium]|nr:hypothetical protein [Chloroflexota bacterium]MCI0728876.1 hypothetical protein [Chloroflexota bacterium]
MPEAAVTVLLVGVALVPGWLLLARLGRRPGDPVALVFASLALGIMLIGWLALALAEIGRFSLATLSGLWLALVLALGLVAWRRQGRATEGRWERARQGDDPPSPPHPLTPSPPLQYAFLIVWLVAAGWLFFRPHEFIIGAADAGVYVNLAATISETGGILIDDPVLAELDPTFYPALLRPLPPGDFTNGIAPYYLFPGFYVTGSPAGRITPQFYHLHPVWQALAYSLGGVRAALWITGLWALLGSLAIYLVVRDIAGWPAAALALAGLALTALQVWFARYPTTETLTQFLLWTGLWSLMRWLRDAEPQPLWGLMAGLALGQVFLTRIDSYFLLAIPGLLWLGLRWSGQWRPAHWWFFLPLALLTTHSLGHALWQSKPYFYSIFGYGLWLLQQNLVLPAAALVGGGALLVLGRYRGHLSRLAGYRRPALLASVPLVLLLAAYGWFIRPHVGEPVFTFQDWYSGGQLPWGLDRENLLRLGWYLSPLGVALATAGSCLLVWRVNRHTVAILTTGLMFALLYLWRIQASPHHIYAARRYVPAVMPFAIVATAALLGWLLAQPRARFVAAGGVLAVAWLGWLGWSARGFVSQVDYQGLIGQVEALNRQLEPEAVLIFNDQSAVTLGDFIGTPLQFLHGHHVYSLRDPAALDPVVFRQAVAGWQQAGRPIYWVGEPEPLAGWGLTADKSWTVTLSSQYLEGAYDHRPSALLRAEWSLTITPITGINGP